MTERRPALTTKVSHYDGGLRLASPRKALAPMLGARIAGSRFLGALAALAISHRSKQCCVACPARFSRLWPPGSSLLPPCPCSPSFAGAVFCRQAFKDWPRLVGAHRQAAQGPVGGRLVGQFGTCRSAQLCLHKMQHALQRLAGTSRTGDGMAMSTLMVLWRAVGWSLRLSGLLRLVGFS